MYSPKEWVLYLTELRERRVDANRIAALRAAALKEPKLSNKAHFAYLDALFPEDVQDRVKFAARNQPMLEAETKKVYEVMATRIRRSGESVLRRRRVKGG